MKKITNLPGATLSAHQNTIMRCLTTKRKGIVFLFVLVFGFVAGVTFAQGDVSGKKRNASPRLKIVAGAEFTPNPPDITCSPNCGGNGPGVLQFSSATYTVSEGAGTLVLPVTRTAGSQNNVSVAYNPSEGAALDPEDYSAPSGNLTWNAGDSTDKTITVTIANDNVYEPNETFTVQLSAPTGGATLGAKSTATITIVDDDSEGADLANLVLSAGAISPAFSSSTTNYTLTVPNSTTSTTVTATLDDSTATMTINGSAATSGAAFGPIDLNPGDTTISIVVTAEDGTTTQTYKPVVHRTPIVTTLGNSGAGSLRQALADAADGDTIAFNFSTGTNAPTVATVITLTSGELIINDSIIIDGPGANALVVERDDAAPNSRIFHVNPGHTVTIEGMTIRNGLLYPGSSGAGILNDRSDLTVDSCNVSDNTADFGGGGILSVGEGGTATLTVTNCNITGNSASTVGGGILNYGERPGSNATLIVSNSTINGNGASFGAGVYNDGVNGMATMSVNNSTFSENTAGQFGGGIANDGFNGGVGNLTVSNSTFYKNTAFSGGGIFTFASSGGTATVDIGNTILQTGATGSDIDTTCFQPPCNSTVTVTSHGYNLSNQGLAGVVIAPGDQINTDPMLGPLKDNGGPTLTHAPLINSPAIDQGKRDTILALTTNFDQRGLTRPVSDPDRVDAADGSDIGAVEIGQFVHPFDAASWKTHGAAGPFSVGLSLLGEASIECRSDGASGVYQIIVNFTPAVSVVDADVTSGTGSVSGTSVSSANRPSRLGTKNTKGTNGLAGNQVTIDLTGVTNAQTIVVALFGVNDGSNTADVGIQMSVLIADTNGTGDVNSTDIVQVKLQSGQVIDEDNFREDVTANGAINSSDISLTKSKSGTALP